MAQLIILLTMDMIIWLTQAECDPLFSDEELGFVSEVVAEGNSPQN